MPRITRETLDAAISAEERERREESVTRRQLARARLELAALEAKVDILTAIDGVRCEPAPWAQPKAARERHAVANLMLSDLHLDEIVDPAQVRGRNAYNREIALQRLKRVADGTIAVTRDYISGITFDGLCLWVNGDLVSGNIHDELRRTNAGAGIVDTIDFWVDPLAELIDVLATHFRRVHVVCSYGNHGRSTLKPETKDAVRSSFDWLLMRIVHRALRGDERITWNIPESMDVREQQYGTRIMMMHGHQFKGGDQIAGAVRPVMMGDYRALVSEVMGGEPYDLLLVGHFHTYTALPRAIINGSLIGFSEYAADRKLRPEVPKQAFWLTTPEHGPSFHLPILPCDRQAEGW